MLQIFYKLRDEDFEFGLRIHEDAGLGARLGKVFREVLDLRVQNPNAPLPSQIGEPSSTVFTVGKCWFARFASVLGCAVSFLGVGTTQSKIRECGE